ncbi:MAG: hypothetical protein U5N86_03090 [Planctomycetota bacterium]|nr:hypothetical protein [Planctomycetota bacterium]
MRRSIVALCLLALFSVAFSATSMGQDDLPMFLKNPHLSPDGRIIAFDYDGDIWTVPASGGEAKRLTVHLAHERRPYFSPDGEWLLYSANYHGYYDLYIMPAEGGEYRRLTYSPGNDIPSGWSADGKHCFYYSFRDHYYDAFKISSEGGIPLRIAYSRRDPVYAPLSSPDGSKVALNYRSGFSDWDRKGNVTPNSSEIFIADNTVPVSNIRRMTENWSQDYLPVWSPEGDSLYFVSDRKGEYNLYSMTVSSGEVKRHTDLSDKGIRWFTVASESGDIVVERKHRLYKLDPNTGETELIPVTFFDPPKLTENDFSITKVDITDFSVAPDGQKVAFISGHDVYIMAASGGYSKPLTRTYEREIHLSWAPDSRHVLFNRIINRGLQIVRLNVYDGTETVLTTGADNKFTPFYMPDGKHIAYQHNYESIRMMDPSDPEAEHEVLARGIFGRRLMQSGRWFDFSADGKWMTYLDYNDMMTLDGKVKKLGADEVFNLSPLGGFNYPGAFTPDYSKFLFTNYNDGEQGVYVIDFKKTVKPRVSPVEKLEELLKPKEPEKKQDPKKTGKPVEKSEEKPSEVPEKLDTTDLYSKTRKLSPAIKGTRYFVHLFKSGRTALVMRYSGNKYAAYACPVDGGKPQPLLQVNARVTGLEVDKQERFFYFVMNGALYRAALSNKKQVKADLRHRDETLK